MPDYEIIGNKGMVEVLRSEGCAKRNDGSRSLAFKADDFGINNDGILNEDKPELATLNLPVHVRLRVRLANNRIFAVLSPCDVESYNEMRKLKVGIVGVTREKRHGLCVGCLHVDLVANKTLCTTARTYGKHQDHGQQGEADAHGVQLLFCPDTIGTTDNPGENNRSQKGLVGIEGIGSVQPKDIKDFALPEADHWSVAIEANGDKLFVGGFGWDSGADDVMRDFFIPEPMPVCAPNLAPGHLRKSVQSLSERSLLVSGAFGQAMTGLEVLQ